MNELKWKFCKKCKTNKINTTESGRLFHDRVAATEKARPLIVERTMTGTISATVTAKHSCCRDLTSATWWRSSARYCGASPFWQWYAKTASRNVIRSGIRSQRRSCNSGVTWSNLLDLKIRCAAAFKIDWSISSWHAGRPARKFD